MPDSHYSTDHGVKGEEYDNILFVIGKGWNLYNFDKYLPMTDEDINIKIDPNDLKQLLIIFIDNSIKYNNKDNIEIDIILKKDVNKFKLEVKDNGIGIPTNEINNVMKRFYKVDKSRVNNNSFGIGLSIANRIANNKITHIIALVFDFNCNFVVFLLLLDFLWSIFLAVLFLGYFFLIGLYSGSNFLGLVSY